RHASLSLVARTPSTLDEEFSARIELERRSRISLDDWLRDLTAIDFAQPAPSSGAQDPAANAPATSALAEPVNPAALVTTQDCSRAVLRDSSLAERIGVPLPASDDEENMDMAPARSYAGVLQGIPPPAVHVLPPVPTPRTSRRHSPAAASTTQPPAAPSAQPSVDVLLANLLVTMQAVGAMLPADHPLRAVFLQAAAVQSSSTNHG
ncbi:hypothetical protein MTO96_043585, partial [Rhipicephalus appendiculatus]